MPGRILGMLYHLSTVRDNEPQVAIMGDLDLFRRPRTNSVSLFDHGEFTYFFFFLRCCGRLGSWVREVLTMQLFHQANYTAIRSINCTILHILSQFFSRRPGPSVTLYSAKSQSLLSDNQREQKLKVKDCDSKLVLVRWDGKTGKAHFHAISIFIIVIISVPWNRMTPRRWSDGFDFLPLVFHPQHQPFSSVAFVNNHVNVQKFFNLQGQRLVCIQFRVRLAISWEQTMM
jgi:hypothetical protein